MRLWLKIALLTSVGMLAGCPEAPTTTDCDINDDPALYCEAGEVCRVVLSKLGQELEGVCVKASPSIRKQRVDAGIEYFNKNAGESGPVKITATATKGDLRTRKVELKKTSDESVRPLVPGENIGRCSAVEFETGAFADGDLIADSATTAFCDVNRDEIADPMEPQVTVYPGATPGQTFIEVDTALELLLPFTNNFYTNPSDAQVTIDIVDGVIINQSTPGIVTKVADATSLDPDGSGEVGPASLITTVEQEQTFNDGTPNESCALQPFNYFFEAPGARSFSIENDATGNVYGPFAINGYPNPQKLPQAINPATLDLFENGAYIGTLGAFWNNPGVCGDIHLNNGGQDDPFLGPNPDPAGCGFGCGKYDDPTPNIAPEISPENSEFNCTDNGASNLCAFPVTVNDEQPGFLSVDLGGSFYFSACFEDSRASTDRELTVLTSCQVPPGSGGTTEILDIFANDGVLSDFGTVTLNINSATGSVPVIDPFDDPVTAAEEAPFFVPINVSGGAAPVEIGSVGLPDWCFTTNTAVNCIAPTGSARLLEPYNSFITATDADGDVSFAKLRLAIAQVNTVPQLGDVPDFNARFGTQIFINIDLTDSDGDFLNFYPNPPDDIQASITGPAATYCSVVYSATGLPERGLQLICFLPVTGISLDGTIKVTDTGVPPLTAQKNFTLTAVDQSFNTAPQCQNIETTVRPDASAALTIKSFDAEIDAVSYVETTGNASCSFTDNNDSTATYSCGAPLPLGTLISNYTATDTRGDSCNATITVTVSDDPGNLPPVANDDDLGAVVIQSQSGNLENILNNDSDPEGETLSLENVTIVTQPTVGTIVQSSSAVDGFPLLYDGPLSSDTLSFEYTVADSEGAVSNLATATFEPSGFVSASLVTADGVPVAIGADLFAYEPGPDSITPIGTVENWGQTPAQPVFATSYSGTPAQLFYAQPSAQELIDDGLDVANDQAWAVTRAADPAEPRRCVIYWNIDESTSAIFFDMSCKAVEEGDQLTVEIREQGTDTLFWDQTVIAASTDTFTPTFWFRSAIPADDPEPLADLYDSSDARTTHYVRVVFDDGLVIYFLSGEFINGRAGGAAAGAGGAAGGAAGAAVGIPVGDGGGDGGGGGGGGGIITTVKLKPAFDFGDAPGSTIDPSYQYPTLLAENGARHGMSPNFHLGAEVDYEQNGIPDAAANGDDADNGLDFPVNDNPDDEDGISFDTPLVPGLTADISIDATIENGADSAFVSAWIDVNRDGDWLDAGEQVLTNLVVVDGINTTTITLPIDGTEGPTYARFRMSAAGNVGPAGATAQGEVEDYLVAIADPDADEDGVPAYLDNCPDVANPGQEDVLGRGVGDACALPADFDGDGNVDWNDVGQYLNRSRLNQPAMQPYDPFDLDGSGTITLLDARKALLLCDIAGCVIL